MENVMTKGFVELSANEMMDVEGGIGWAAVVGLVLLGGLIICGTKGCADAEAGK